MQRATLLAMIPVGLWLSACGDKAAPAIVDEDTIRWQLSGPSISFKPHSPADSEDDDFKVSCSISGESVEFTITAPKIEEQGRPSSKLVVRRGNPKSRTCIVQVTEAPNLVDSAFSVQDVCPGTGEDGGCTLTGEFDKDGWEFNGTLACTNLKKEPTDVPLSLASSVASGTPVVIKLDNCD